MAETPQSCLDRELDCDRRKPPVYTFAELGRWVHLLTKRAEYRTNLAKKDEDLHDARNYLALMQAKLDEVCSLTLENFASKIMSELESKTSVELLDVEPTSSIYVSWDIQDKESPRCFDDFYHIYLKPALHMMVKKLATVKGVCVIGKQPDDEYKKVSVVTSPTMSIKLTSHYKCGDGDKPGCVVMVVQIGTVE